MVWTFSRAAKTEKNGYLVPVKLVRLKNSQYSAAAAQPQQYLRQAAEGIPANAMKRQPA